MAKFVKFVFIDTWYQAASLLAHLHSVFILLLPGYT